MKTSTGVALCVGFALAVAMAGLALVPAMAEQGYGPQRARMVKVIEAHARDSSHALDGPRLDSEVRDVMGKVPRHEFVPEDLRSKAYFDRPLPIGYGQTISQPFIVALMTDLLQIEPDDVVLEIGTGSGYQAAVLAELAREVCTIEIIPELGDSATERLERLGYTNIKTRIGDGYYGWPDCGPFDGIVVTAAAGHVPPPLIQQLKPGGRMVIPVGPPFVVQQLMLVEKREDGKVTNRQLLPVAFVPLRRKEP